MGVGLEGRVVEPVAGKPFLDFITGLLLLPNRMTRSSVFLEDLVDYPVEASHLLTPDGVKVERPVGSGFLSAATAPIGDWAREQRDAAADHPRVLGSQLFGVSGLGG